MKKYLLILALFLLYPLFMYTQTLGTVSGRLIDQNGNGLSDLQLQLHINHAVYNTVSNSEGVFVFDNVTKVIDEQFPSGYLVSDNYPNPFNPKTRIAVTLPAGCNVKVSVFNLLGQSVIDKIERSVSAGNSFIDLELSGLPNGFYLARIELDERYAVVRKLMLLYGSQHLPSSSSKSFPPLNKAAPETKLILNTKIDSLVVTGLSIIKKIFTNLPDITNSSFNLGNLIIERICPGESSVLYAGKNYKTVLIGSQCWLKENLDVGAMIQSNQDAGNNSVIEKYCYNNDLNNCAIYGGLYQWNEIMAYSTTPGTKGICPDGWHIPTKVEFEQLANSNLVQNNGNALKELGQGTGSGAGTNSSGFSALLSGYRGNDGTSNFLGAHTRFWSSTESITYGVNFIHLYGNLGNVGSGDGGDKDFGYSVRCVHD